MKTGGRRYWTSCVPTSLGSIQVFLDLEPERQPERDPPSCLITHLAWRESIVEART